MIASFADRETEAVWRREFVRKFGPDVQRAALRKLTQVHAAARLDDLRSPPGNRLEALRGDREGQYSIRVNDQWRICFRWKDGAAHDVELADYH
jgi:proteic killer suppression protein